MQVGRTHIEALSSCKALEALLIGQYVADPGPFSMEEFAGLSALRSLALRFTAHGSKWVLCSLKLKLSPHF